MHNVHIDFFSYDPVCPSVGRLVGMLVCLFVSISYKSEKLPIGELVLNTLSLSNI